MSTFEDVTQMLIQQTMLLRLLNRNVCFDILFLSWLIHYNKCSVSSRVCEGKYNGCCDGYFRDPNNSTCEKCQPGYRGPNCTDTCPFPSYGDRCQGYCNCSNDSCDASTGCRTMTTDKMLSTAFMTKVSTLLELNSTHTTENSREKSTGAQIKYKNQILIVLIQIFGCADILLICIYVIIFVHDRKKETNVNNIENMNELISGNISVYENIDHVALSYD